jgi:hypothetical protein
VTLKKLTLKAGVNRENTRYTNENGWYDCDKIRFRQGTPEKIGGWAKISTSFFLGVCRSLWNWLSLGGISLTGVGTNLKFYIERGGLYYDVTPLSSSRTLGNNPFATTINSPIVTVTDTVTTLVTNSYVTFSGATAVGGLTLNGNYLLTLITSTTYTIDAGVDATSTATGGGASVLAEYEIPAGAEIEVSTSGWGAGAWGIGTWGIGSTSVTPLRLWSQVNFGQDLLFNPRGGGLYIWTVTGGVSARGVLVSSTIGAAAVPTVINSIFVSDVSRFVFALGCNDIAVAEIDPLLIRWSDQEDVTNWSPASVNQAGSIRLSHGSKIVTSVQSRQEIVVWTDTSVYSLQYVGAPIVWGTSLVGDNTSIVSQNSAVYANGVSYWMGVDKFYKYDGRVQTLRCDLRQYIYGDLNYTQLQQVCCGSNEGFNEIWWFYPSANSLVNDKYAVYNYLDDIWYYGLLGRTAWLDSSVNTGPIAATYSNNIVVHETGNDDGTGVATEPITSFITSAEFDLEDGHSFAFVWRVLPDITFRGSTGESPAVTMYLYPLKNSGSGYTNPPSVGGENNAAVIRTAVLPVEEFTGQIFTRVRGRQLSIKVESTALGTTWQLGSPRIDIRPDGRR